MLAEDGGHGTAEFPRVLREPDRGQIHVDEVIHLEQCRRQVRFLENGAVDKCAAENGAGQRAAEIRFRQVGTGQNGVSKIGVLKFVCFRFARARLAPVRSAPVRFALPILAWTRLARTSRAASQVRVVLRSGRRLAEIGGPDQGAGPEVDVEHVRADKAACFQNGPSKVHASQNGASEWRDPPRHRRATGRSNPPSGNSRGRERPRHVGTGEGPTGEIQAGALSEGQRQRWPPGFRFRCLSCSRISIKRPWVSRSDKVIGPPSLRHGTGSRPQRCPWSCPIAASRQFRRHAFVSRR